ncbi:MAG: hypothetical protein JNK18_06790 [Cyclobacteriaceae bacterium]|nr:hypothetical protein [Cyclobacteriaceae bacterium]
MNKIFFLFLVAICWVACVAEDSSNAGERAGAKTRTSQAVKAIVLDEGEPAADGCGWTLMIDSTRYKPTNLSDEFKMTDLKVKVTYEELETIYRCGIAALPMPELKILTIEKD